VFAQWLQLYEIDDELVLSVLSAISENFPSWEIFMSSNKDALIVASSGPLREPDWSVLRHPGIAQDLSFTWPISDGALNRLRVANRSSLEPLLRRLHETNSDYYPTLDLNAERTRFMQNSAKGLQNLTLGINIPAIVSGRRLGPGDSYAVIPSVEPLRLMALNGAMRNGDPRGGTAARDAAARVHAFEAETNNGRDPVDWRAWVRAFSEINQLKHGGMSGVEDTAFFVRVHAYLDRHNAPREARAAVAFAQAMASWDYRAATVAADPLIRAAVHLDPWVDSDYLRDGAVIAMLRTGDRRGAADAFQALAPRSTRPESDLRTRLLLSYVLDSANVAGKGHALRR
jgi:hypothetical protein